MQSRRKFLGGVASGLAGTLASPPVLGANERIRLGVLGAGERGMVLLREAMSCPHTEIAAVADVYSRRAEEAAKIAPAAKLYADFRSLLDETAIDALLIATPQHLHAEHFIAAVAAGKHIYLEKAMAFTVDQAKQMRAAYRNAAGKLTVQIGHQGCSSGLMEDARKFATAENLGKVSAIVARMFRNTPHGKPQWSRPVYPDMTPENIRWEQFLGGAPAREFDPHRFANWRLYWDYSGGNVFENMSQQLCFWTKVLDLEIPARASMTGGVHVWQDGREVPDTMQVTLEYAGGLMFSWTSGFGNNHLGVSEDVLGTDGTLSKGQQIRYYPQKVNRPQANELAGMERTPPAAHLRNFLDSVRGGATPNCPFETGYRVSIACRMAVESYHQQRPVWWDAAREEIV